MRDRMRENKKEEKEEELKTCLHNVYTPSSNNEVEGGSNKLYGSLNWSGVARLLNKRKTVHMSFNILTFIYIFRAASVESMVGGMGRSL